MILPRIHILLAIAVVGLLAMGLAVLASAGYYSKEGGGIAYTLITKQSIWAALGLALLCTAGVIDFHRLYQWRWYFFALAVVTLGLCFMPGVGQSVNGANRWIRIGSVQGQPSEFAKIALAILLAAWYSQHETQSRSFLKGCFYPFCFMAVIAALIGLEMDLGSGLITCAVGILCMYVGGMRKRYLPLVALVIVVAAVCAAKSSENRTKRIRAYLTDLPEVVSQYGVKLPIVGELFDLSKITKDEWKFINESKLQQEKSVMAFGSGGLAGAGIGQGRMVMYGLPEAHTDFILPNLGEELGLLGSLGVVFCFACIVVTGMCISSYAPTRFGKLLGMSLTSLLGLEGFVNMCVVTGIFPNKGLPLPLVSYGGCSLMMSLAAVGILFSIHRQGVYVSADEIKLLNRRHRWTPSV
jgi:cell division protein FtsW